MRKMDRFIITGGLTAALFLTGVTGCASRHRKEAEQTGRSVAQLATDNRISEVVKQQLDTAPIYKFPSVGVTTYQNTVQLSGFVGTEDQKRAATEIAQGVPGVNRVINNIAVVPQTPQPTGRDSQTSPSTQPGQSDQPYRAPEVKQSTEPIPGAQPDQSSQEPLNHSTPSQPGQSE